MTTTYSTDAQVYARVPLVAKALARVNAERTSASLSAATLDDYRVEAQTLLQRDLSARGVETTAIVDTTSLMEPERLLAAVLVFEAAMVRSDGRAGVPDVFGDAAKTWRALYETALATARPRGSDVLPEGSTFTWERG